jgi:hypothetical protein
MLDKLRSWWKGEEYHIEGVFPGIRYRRHWTANIARVCSIFYLKNWQWCLGFAVAIAGLTAAIMKLG